MRLQEKIQELTVPWTQYVWITCVTTKSSNLLFAPAATEAGVKAGFLWRHLTASM
jgi:hypothetical protein